LVILEGTSRTKTPLIACYSVINKKVQELPPDLVEPEGNLLKNAAIGSTVNGKRYGSPHWVWGNFLFFNSSDMQIRKTKKLADLVRIIGRTLPKDRGLAIDLMRKSTLGEFYLNAAFDRYHDWPNVQPHAGFYDFRLKSDILALAPMCKAMGCRDPRLPRHAIFCRGVCRETFPRIHWLLERAQWCLESKQRSEKVQPLESMPERQRY
jgi:hypothetical protein